MGTPPSMTKELLLASRLPEIVLLMYGAAVEVELSGKNEPERAAFNQAAAYARNPQLTSSPQRAMELVLTSS